MPLSQLQYQALSAWCQWELGDKSWATAISHLLGAENPKESLRLIIGDSDFETVWEEAGRSLPWIS